MHDLISDSLPAFYSDTATTTTVPISYNRHR
uniref:Uncharacterized protein n=1 Tax=Rhizophora mucronata TaxID=61149 RepID=A0A2P2N5Z1_RHIMU